VYDSLWRGGIAYPATDRAGGSVDAQQREVSTRHPQALSVGSYFQIVDGGAGRAERSQNDEYLDDDLFRARIGKSQLSAYGLRPLGCRPVLEEAVADVQSLYLCLAMDQGQVAALVVPFQRIQGGDLGSKVIFSFCVSSSEQPGSRLPTRRRSL
jgi:hypothetical protein